MDKEKIHTKGYKKTKLGWIPEDWLITSVNEVFKFLKTTSFSRNQLNYNQESEIFYIHYGDIHSTFQTPILNFEQNDKIPRLNNLKAENQDYLKNGDLIVADASEDYDGVGESIEIANLKGKAISGLHTLALRDYTGKTIEGFRAYVFKNPVVNKSLKVIATGSKVFGISKSNVQKLFIALPKLSEQKAIADCLSTWDTAITKLTSLIKAKELQKKALMQQLLTGKKRLPGFEDDWKTQRLAEFFDERKETNRGELTLLSIGEAGVYPQSQSNKKDTSNTDKSKYKRILPNDIGYNTMRMWQGRSALSGLEGIVSPAYTIVKPKINTDPVFFSYLFKFSPVIHKFYRNSQGLVSDTLNCKFKDFSIVKVSLPTKREEQTAIAKVLTRADKEIDLLQKELKQLQLQKKGMMQQLLIGKKRLKM